MALVVPLAQLTTAFPPITQVHPVCCPGLSRLYLMGNLPFSASRISFPPILNWSLPQACNFAHPLWSRSKTGHSLGRKPHLRQTPHPLSPYLARSTGAG